jgi:radical SAM superfamily enzyme YgiQ (UPF0313 family)
LGKENSLILFVNPSLGTQRYTDEDRLRSYLSLGTLASALRNRAFLKRFSERLGRKDIIFNTENDYPVIDVVVLNLSLKPRRRSIQAYFSDYLKSLNQTPFMVCMTATSAHLDEAQAIARAAKQKAPAALRIIGGPHVSVAARDFLKHSEFQVACIGEGVETLSEIVLQISGTPNRDLSMVAGIAFKHDGNRVCFNPLRVPLLELDEYPFPSDSLELFRKSDGDPAQNQNQLIYILAGYGCPHDCIFCAQRSLHGRKLRERSAGNIIEEIGRQYAGGFRKFAFVQETFLNGKKRIDEFCRLIGESGMRIEWTAEARADQLDYERLKKMRASGLQFIQIGVESGDPALLKKIGKGIDLDRIIQVRDWCRRLRIHTAVYLLVGLPDQDWQSVLRSALFITDHPPYNRITKHASVSIAIPYPGTRMWQAQTVRLIQTDAVKSSWPQRNPEVFVNDAGEFLGKNFTETDDLTANEILEAWIYLDDYCHFLLHALDESQTDGNPMSRSMEYAGRMLYMIQRRTIRDLIVRARCDPAADLRKNAYHELIQFDGDSEKHFKDITAHTEPTFDVLVRFLATARYINGFETMRRLSIANRIKWMKICAMVWHLNGRKIDGFRFDNDDQKTGLDLDRRLRALDELQLNRYLAQIDGGISAGAFPDINSINQQFLAFGIGFSVVENRILEIDLQ